LLERVKNCNLCGSTNYWPLFTVKKTVPIVKCSNCGLLYVTPRQVWEENKQLYQTESYFKNENILLYGYHNYIDEEFLYRPLFERRIKVLEKLKPEKGRVLDVGCAAGFFLDVAQSHGWKAQGVELSSFAAQYARDRFKLNIFNGTLMDAKLPDKFFDVVVMDDVIEHVFDPMAQLREAHRILREGGVLTLNTPNAGGFLRKVMRRRWFHFKEDHVYYFSHETIEKALKSAGFRLMAIKPSGKVVTMRYLFGRLNHYSRSLAHYLSKAFENTGFIDKPFYLYIGEMVVYARK